MPALLLAAALLLLVAALGALVRGDTFVTRTDTDIATAVAGWRPAGLVDAAELLTYLGQFVFTAPFTMLAGLVLWRAGRGLVSAAPLTAVLLGSGATALVKAIVERPRPDEVLHAVVIDGFGYSSGHAAGAAACWLALALTASAAAPPRRAPLVAGALAVAVLVSATRIVLGVHSFSDVIGGMALGGACALLAFHGLSAIAARRG